MPDLDAIINNFAVGDDFDVEREITGIPDGATLTKAWLTVKTRPVDVDVDAIFQIEITTAYVSGAGQITDDGADGTGGVRFEVSKTNSALLQPERKYYFDVQVKSNTGKIYTPYAGTIRGRRGMTDATA